MMRALGLATLMLSLAVGVPGLLEHMSAASVPRLQDLTAIAQVEIGAGPVGEPSLRFVGINEYRESSIVLYGYLTSVIGLDQALIFSDPDAPSETTARFTYVGEIAVTGLSEFGALTEVRGSGILKFYLDDGGADFGDPASFADGTAIATTQLRLEDTLQIQAPALGLTVGDEELTQVAVEPFTLAGERYRFGHVGLRERLVFTGAETRIDPASPAVVISLSGSVVVTHREPQPAGEQNSEATPTGETLTSDDCTAVEAWLAETVAHIERASAIDDDISQDTIADSLDAEALRAFATELSEIAAVQRGTEVPTAVMATNRLLVTAFSTYSRGANLLAVGVTDQDELSVARGRETIQDGDDLVARATTEISQLEAACEIAR